MATRRQARQLGLMMAMISVAAGLWPLWSGAAPHWVALGLAGALTAVALLRPAWLGPPATAWRWLGLALHRVTSPVLWAVIYFVVITPVAVLMRLAGRDVLGRTRDPNATTYWTERPPARSPRSLERPY